jgi:exonuclease VII small subunit
LAADDLAEDLERAEKRIRHLEARLQIAEETIVALTGGEDPADHSTEMYYRAKEAMERCERAVVASNKLADLLENGWPCDIHGDADCDECCEVETDRLIAEVRAIGK